MHAWCGMIPTDRIRNEEQTFGNSGLARGERTDAKLRLKPRIGFPYVKYKVINKSAKR